MSRKTETSDPRLHLEDALILTWAAVSSKIQDKYSIDDQLTLEREWCAKHRCTIVEELVVRGFSRDYWTLADVVAAAAHDPDMEAFAKLQAHIRKKSFTVFLCFDADRFGRTMSLVHEVIGRITRDCEALIYTLFDGVWMDAESAPMIGTMKAFKAQTDLTKLVEYRVTGMDNRARDGKSTSMILPLFQQRIRDEHGKETAVIINEDHRPLYTDIATLILRGESWTSMERLLFEEFGHGRYGKPFYAGSIRRMVLHYAWWGHAAINYNVKKKRHVQNIGPWLWDEFTPAPPPVVVYRNRYPAVYSGQWADLGEQVKAELWRRHSLKGKAYSLNTFRFHGLLACAECGATMDKAANSQHPERVYLRCGTKFVNKYNGIGDCTQSKHIRADVVQEYFTVQLQKQLDRLPSMLFDQLDDSEAIQRQITDLEKQLDRLQKRNETSVSELVDAPVQARPVFRQKIADTSTEIERAQDALEGLRGQLAGKTDMQQRQHEFLQELRENGIGWLWTLPDTAIHQRLSSALGENQFIVREGQIVGRDIATSHQILSQRRSPKY